MWSNGEETNFEILKIRKKVGVNLISSGEFKYIRWDVKVGNGASLYVKLVTAQETMLCDQVYSAAGEVYTHVCIMLSTDICGGSSYACVFWQVNMMPVIAIYVLVIRKLLAVGQYIIIFYYYSELNITNDTVSYRTFYVTMFIV